jgi:hypothetical protein
MACRWFYCIGSKSKVFRIRFIFDFKIVFIWKFLKMTPIRVRFRPGFPPGAGFGFTGEEPEFAQAWFLLHLKIREKNALREILL